MDGQSLTHAPDLGFVRIDAIQVPVRQRTVANPEFQCSYQA